MMKARGLYMIDRIVILAFMAGGLAVLYLVGRDAIDVAPGAGAAFVILAAAGLAGIFSTASLMALLNHLRRNRDSLYGQDAPQRQGKE